MIQISAVSISTVLDYFAFLSLLAAVEFPSDIAVGLYCAIVIAVTGEGPSQWNSIVYSTVLLALLTDESVNKVQLQRS